MFGMEITAARFKYTMHIGHRDFIDGQTRAVHIDDDGNQYVYDDAGQPVFGAWLMPDATEADSPTFLPCLDDGQGFFAGAP